MALVEFIIPTYNRIAPLYSMLASLVAQSNSNWEAHVVVDDVDNQITRKIVSSFNLDKIKISFIGKRYNDWGHNAREFGKQMSTSEYVVMTGDDNYYTPNFVNELYKTISLSQFPPGIIYWDMVHSHYGYACFKCQLGCGQIDMGAFATRTDLAKQIHLTSRYDADGEYVRNLVDEFPDEIKIGIDKILFVHN